MNTKLYLLRQRVLQRDKHKCVYCGAPAEHIDHVIAQARGGSNYINNLISACVRCNCAKGAVDWVTWYRGKPFYQKSCEDRIIAITNTSPFGNGEIEVEAVAVK